MKRLIVALVIVVLLLLSISCAQAVPGPAPTTKAITTTTSTVVPATTSTGQTGSTDRMTTRNAKMSLLVEDVTTAVNKITQLAQSLQGYVVSSQIWRDIDRVHGTISIRIPSKDYDNAMKSLTDLSVQVTSLNSSSQDVTEEYVDLNAQLQNLQSTEQQLLKVMQQAENVTDILSVQAEVSKVQGQIDQIKGRMQYLETTSATSLIEVTVEESKPQVTFSADNTKVDQGEKIQFSSYVTGGISPFSYEWYFGDGSMSSDAQPTHQYETPGDYTIVLKVTDSLGKTGIMVRNNYITIVPPWSGSTTARSAWNGFMAFNRGFANFIIWFGIFSPVWLVIGGLIFWRRWHKKKVLQARKNITQPPQV